MFGIILRQPWLVKLGMTIAGAGVGVPGNFGNFPSTPPTFPDPLGNTQATLNSIYHPGDLSKYGIEDFTINRNADQFKDLLYTVYGDRITDCIKGIFGDRFASRHPQSLRNSPRIDASQTGGQLAQKVDWSGVAPETPRTSVQATYDATRGPNGTVEIGSEYWQNPNGYQDLQGSYVHELGNILATRYFHDANRFGDQRGVGVARDTDTGANLQICVFGRVNF